MTGPTSNQPRAAAIEQSTLLPLPEWALLDNLGDLTPAQIREAIRAHARAAWHMGKDYGMSRLPAAAGASHPELPSLDEAMASDELQQLKAEAKAKAADGVNWSMDVGCMFVLAMIERIESAASAPQHAGYIDRADLSRLGKCRVTLWPTQEAIDAMPVMLAPLTAMGGTGSGQ